MTDVNIKIDGDTSAYDATVERSVAKTKEIGHAVKEAHEPLKKMGEFSNEALKTLTGFAVPLSAAGAAMGLLEGFAENYNRRLEKTREIMREVTELHEKMAANGRGGQSVEITNAMRKAAINLNNGEIGEVYAGTTGATGLPNATTTQLADAARAAQTAQLAGLKDIGGFAKTRASLVASGVANADADAYYLERYAPETKDNALGAIRKFPEQAEDISRLFQAAGREEGKGRKGLEQIIRTGLDLYGLDRKLNPNSKTTFLEAMRGSIGQRAAGDQAGEINRQFLLGQVAQPIDDEEMDRNAEENEKDPALRAASTIKRNKARGADVLQGDLGAKVLSKDVRNSRYEAMGIENSLWYKSFLFLSSLAGEVSGTRTQGQVMSDYAANGGDKTYDDFMKDDAARNSGNSAHAEHMRNSAKIMDIMSRRRLSAQTSQNGDK